MFYNFVKTIANNLGVGTSNKAFAKSQTNPVYSVYGPAYNVQGQLASTVGGAMMINKQIVIVGITGNGAMPNGSVNLTPLAEVENNG